MKKLILLALVALFLSACSLASDVTPPPGYVAPTSAPTQPPIEGPLFPAAPPSPARGAAIFVEKCAPCHGATGLGDGPRAQTLKDQNISVPALGVSDFARSATPARWFSVVTLGNLKRFMPPFTSLTDAERWDVVAYAFSLSSPADAIAAGQKLYQANECAKCHAEQVRFDDQQRMADRSALNLYTILTDGQEKMPAYADKLSDDERWQLAAYLRSLTWTTEPTAVSTPEVVATPEVSAPLTVTGAISGTVTGAITNASGGTVPAGITVTLYTFDQSDNGPRLILTSTVASDAQGQYSFKDIQLQPGYILGAAVDYQTALYGSRIVSLDTITTTTISLPIEIYDSTTDASVLVVDRMHLIVSFEQPGQVTVMEIYAISNPSKQTVIASQTGLPVVTFPTPPNAVNLQIQGETLGERFIPVPGGLADTQPVYPGVGGYQVSFGFSLPYTGQLDFSQPVAMNTTAATILLSGSAVKLTSSQFRDGGLFEGTTYHRYDAENLSTGGQINFGLSGLAGGAENPALPDTHQTLVIGIAVLGLTLVAAGVWVYRRTRAPEPEPEDEEAEPETLVAPIVDADTLMDTIIALDDQFQAGQIPEDAYRTRRAELKTQLQQRLGDKASG